MLLFSDVLSVYTLTKVGNTYLRYKYVSSVRSGMAARYTS